MVAPATIFAASKFGLDTLSGISSGRKNRKAARLQRSAVTVQLNAQSTAIQSEITEIKRRTDAEAQIRDGVKSQLSRAKENRPGVADLFGTEATTAGPTRRASTPITPVIIAGVVAVAAVFFLR